MFPSFTGSARRPRQVNLSGRSSNPFSANAASKQSPSAQTTQNTIAHAQAERALRQQERRRPPAAVAIQRSWRGYRDRKQTKLSWKKKWDAKEDTDLAPEKSNATDNTTLIPYKDETSCRDQLNLLVHFASAKDSNDQNRLRHFAVRYLGLRADLQWPALPESWIFPLLRLGRLTVSVLRRLERSTAPENVITLLELLCTLAQDIPKQMASTSEQYYQALGTVMSRFGGAEDIWQARDKRWFDESVVALLRPNTEKRISAYEGFASQLMCRMNIPMDTLQNISNDVQIGDLALALSNLIAAQHSLLHSRCREELFWLVAYFIYFHSSTWRLDRQVNQQDALYVNVLSKIISDLSEDIGIRIDVPSVFMGPESDAPRTPTLSSRHPLPPFVRKQILSLISQDHVSGLLSQAASSTHPDSELSRSLPSALAAYALTLLRAFPQRGDEIRMWLYLGSTPSNYGNTASPLPAIKYYYSAASETTVYKLIKNEPSHAINLLNPSVRSRIDATRILDRDQQWQVILLFLELYPIVLKVMDDEEFLGGSESTESSGSWTRQSALTLDQVKDLTIFLKNLAFSMYWNASEIAGIEKTEYKNSIAEYFSGNLSAITDNHPDARSTKPRDITIANLPGMTMSYMKGIVTGLLRMIYERE